MPYSSLRLNKPCKNDFVYIFLVLLFQVIKTNVGELIIKSVRIDANTVKEGLLSILIFCKPYPTCFERVTKKKSLFGFAFALTLLSLLAVI